MTAWYNEIDPFAVDWLRQLIKAGHIAPGVVDTRDIRDISPQDLDGFTQLHFFAGIGGWSLALRQAGWPDDRPVWTGSCPCQPFSASGKQRGFDDDRHLWPAWFSLIKAFKPSTLLGEQVASKPALMWFDLVSADLENAGYTSGAADLCAAGLGAPRMRQRLWFGASLRGVENTNGACVPSGVQDAETVQRAKEKRPPDRSARSDRAGRLGNATGGRCRQSRHPRPQSPKRAALASATGRIANANRPRSQGRARKPGADQRPLGAQGLAEQTPWADPDWIWCRDDKWRPVEPGLCPLVDGLPTRVGRLRAYGNAIVPQVASTFITAFEDSFLDQAHLNS